MKTKAWAALLLPLQLGVAATTAEAKTIFADDFDAGDTVCWSSTVGASQARSLGGAPGRAVSCQTITDVSPDPTVSGSDITITGTGFGASQGASQVRYDGNAIAVGSWSDTSIDATLPIPETNGVHALGVVVSGRAVTVDHSIVNVETCVPVEVADFHGGSFIGNSRLARIEDGHVPCVQMDLATLASCAFSTEAGRQSGEWLESPEGEFALVGQAIALDGTPGGEYVVAAQASPQSPAACVDSPAMDTAGRVAEGTELGTTCTVEDLSTSYNAMSTGQNGFWPLINFTNREVCTSTGEHPDFAHLVRSYPASGTGPDDTFCYDGPGAALNDSGGIERDGLGVYYSGEEYCHYIQLSGYEVPAAKRPATYSYPAPGGLNTQSPILWRPVSPGFDIANDDGLSNVETIEDKQEFLSATGAATATGALPDLGEVASGTTVGTVTFSLALGGNTLSIGTIGTGAEPDYYPALPGNDIALGYENLQLQTLTPVFSLGFDFVEPNATMPSYGGTPVDSTFDVVLYAGASEIGRTSFNAPDDEVTFVGVWSERAFDRVTIVDRTGSGDDEFFGQFYTGLTPSQ